MLSPGPMRMGAAATYVRQDGSQVFFDRRARSADPLETLRPGWDWLARRADGQMLGHPAKGAAAGQGSGLFLPRKFKTALEAMRVLNLEAPLPAAPTPTANDAGKVRKRISIGRAGPGA